MLLFFRRVMVKDICAKRPPSADKDIEKQTQDNWKLV